MPDYIDFPEVEDIIVKSKNEEYQEVKSSKSENSKKNEDEFPFVFKDSDFNLKNLNPEDDDNDYYISHENTYNDSTLVILLSIGTLISLGILANSILT